MNANFLKKLEEFLIDLDNLGFSKADELLQELKVIKQQELKVIQTDYQPDIERSCPVCGGSGKLKCDYSDFKLYGMTHEECSICGGHGKLRVRKE
jgi:hypothetical protein